MNNRMKSFSAPDGYLYDWVEPHTAVVILEDGTKEETIEHLNVKYLFLGSMDDIKNYKLVPETKKGK